MARLTLTRERTLWVDRGRTYTLLVDDKPGGSLRAGETIEVEVPARPVRIRMAIDWASSRELVIDGTEDSILRCKAATNPLLAFLWVTIWSDRYIDLWQVLNAPELA